MAEQEVDGTTGITEEAAPKEAEGFDAMVAESDAPPVVAEVTEEAAETETTEDVESTEGVESITDEQYAKAEKMGITRSQADEIGVDGLPRVMRKLTPPDSAQTSDAPADRDATETLVEEPPGEQTGVELDPDIYDAELVKYIDDGRKRVDDEVSRRLGPMQARLHKLTVEAELREERESSARFAGMVESLGDGYHKEFGTDTPTSTQQANRSKIRSSMEIESAGRDSLGYPALSEDQLFHRAISGEHPTKAKQLAREEIASTLTKRTTKNISRPTQTKGSKQSGRDKALRSVASKMVARGLDEGNTADIGDDAGIFDP